MARRRFTRRLPRSARRLAWVTNVFNEVSVDRAAAINFFVAVEAADWQGDTQSLTKRAHVRRTIVNGVVTATPTSTALELDSVILFYALLVCDAEETDNNIVSSAAGSLLQAHRVLHVGCKGYAGIEIPSAQMGTNWIPGVDIDIDIRSNVVLEPDEQLRLAIQYGGGVTGVLADSRFSGYCRTLIENP